MDFGIHFESDPCSTRRWLSVLLQPIEIDQDLYGRLCIIVRRQI